jgi:CheY-like chemotaxis protein
MSGKVILIVDDDRNWRETMVCVLEQKKLKVLQAVDGRKGVELAKIEKPDLIILDNKMPNMSGEEAIRILRREPETKNIPIIMVTGMDMDQATVDLIKMEVDDFLKKPFSVDFLMKKIEEKLGKIEKEDRIKISFASYKIAVSLEKSAIKQVVKQALGDTAEIYDFKDCGEMLEKIKEDPPNLIIANYRTAGFGSSNGLKLIIQAIVKNIPVLIDAADGVPGVEEKLEKIGKRFCFLRGVDNDRLSDEMKDIFGLFRIL